MNRHLNRISVLILICLGIYSQLWIIIDTLNLQVDRYFPYWLLALCVFAWISTVYRQGLLLGLPLFGLTLYGAYRFYDSDLVDELFAVFDKITGIYYEHIFAPGDIYEYTFYADSSSLILLFLGFLLAAYLAAALTSQSGRIFMSCLGTVPLFVVCIAVNGRPPIPAVLCALLFWALLFSGGGVYNTDGHTGRAVLSSALPCVALLCILLYFNNPNTYQFDQRDIELSQRFDQISQFLHRWFNKGTTEFVSGYTQAIDNLLSGSENSYVPPSPDTSQSQVSDFSAWHSGSGAMDLTTPFDIESADEVVMDVRADVRGTLYLRSCSYGDYAGDHWEQAETPDGLSSLSFAALSLASGNTREHHLDLRPRTVFSFQHLPYYSIVSSVSDSFVPDQSRALYSGPFYVFPGQVGNLSVPSEFAQQELDYRSFAHSYYVKLPDYTRQVMLTLAENAGIRADSPDLIQQVADFVQNAGEYDLYTPAYPSRDYAVYFLTEAHRGYCIHFATAATAMYRALDVPARVTDGYLFLAKAGEFIPVSGANAHAWVEIYQDGFGWIPVEVTGQNSADAFAQLDPEALNEDGSGDESADSHSGNIPPSPSETPQLTIGVLQSPEAANKTSAFVGSRIILLFSPILVFLVLLCWSLFIHKIIHRKLAQNDLRKASVSLWRCAVWLGKYGLPVPETIIKCAERAAFSQHAITSDEYLAAYRAYEGMLHEAQERYSFWKKLYLRYLLGIL